MLLRRERAQYTPKSKRKQVLITRLFSVTLPPCPPPAVDGRNIPQPACEHTSTPTSSVGSTSGFPFPKVVGGGSGQTSASSSSAQRVPKPIKSTMYGVGLIISLPPTASASTSSFPMRCCYHKPFVVYDSNYPHHHDYCCPTPTSFEEDYHTLPPASVECGLDAQSAPSANDGRMDLITKHWDVITRALSDLQRVALEQILENLTVARLQSPQPAPAVQGGGIRYLSNRAELRKMGLMRDTVLRTEVERLRWRVVSSIRVPRVVVGQGRWDLWKEEAKWANHRFGGRDMNLSVDLNHSLIRGLARNPHMHTDCCVTEYPVSS